MRKGQSAPRTLTQGLRAKAWWVLRKNRTMTLAELQLTVCDGSEKCAGNNLRRWLNQLVSAGLVARALEPDGILASNGSHRYTLVKDWGARAPVVRVSSGVVFDPNGVDCVPIGGGYE